MHYRYATADDIASLARMNHALIRDEGHRNRMSVAELEARMAEWLGGEYRAVLIEDAGPPIGYALYRRDAEHVYLRQFFVAPESRRRGVGRAAIQWLRQHAWSGENRIRVEVLVGNSAGIAFWRAVGFEDYCLTLELEASGNAGKSTESDGGRVLLEIREERPGDIAAIRDVNHRAFGQEQEVNIVDALRTNGAVLLSLVATLKDEVVGHIMYSPVTVADEVSGAALGPMAVLPQHQGQGIGSKLVIAGNQKIKEAGWPFIIVLGHADFYPRFGFQPASTHGITCEWQVPDEVFMLLVLDPTKMRRVSGLARYRHEFSSVT
jgi:putative acetyltransferase